MATPVVPARIPTDLIEKMDADVTAEKYPNRAQAIVCIVREHYDEPKKRKRSKPSP
jgi:metal-responsive CopG/Arc/MetJ family transcriptional regulator